MQNMAKTGPAPMLDFLDYVPRDDKERLQLVRSLVGSGVAPGPAWNLMELLERLGKTGDDGLGSSNSAYVQRSRYRRMLARLGEPPWDRLRFGDKGALISSVNELADRRRRGRAPSWGRRWGRPMSLLERVAS